MGVGDDEVGVSTNEAAQAAVSAATVAEQYEVIDFEFRSVIADVSGVVVEPPVVDGVLMFGEEHLINLVALRSHMQGVSDGAAAGGQAAAETDRGNSERFEPYAF